MTNRIPKRTRILLVDDHPVVRWGLSALLRGQPEFEICGEAGSFEEGERLIATLRPDVVILDITLKDRNGLALIPYARRVRPDIKVLVLSMHDERDYAETAIRAGAHGYVMKEQADAVLFEALQTVLQGGTYVSDRMAARLQSAQEGAAGSTSAPETGVESLTLREREIFEMIGRGLTTPAIAERLRISPRTVEVHRTHIKQKLGCESAAELVRAAVRWLESKKPPSSAS